MYAITGITGKVGGELARTLLASGQKVRAVLRDEKKGADWAARGCEVAIADMNDARALTAAFCGATGVFIVLPPEFDPAPGYPEARAVVASLVQALTASRPGKVLDLSTVGADAGQDNLLSQHTLLEEALGTLSLPVTLLRAAWFLDNALWDIPSVRETGILRSFLQPMRKAFPMVAAEDVGKTAAKLIQERWQGMRVVALEGPARVSANDLARAFAIALGKPVRAEPVPRASWESLFRSQGMKHPGPRMQMLDGFNDGWIDFADHGSTALKGQTSAESVIASLVARTAA